MKQKNDFDIGGPPNIIKNKPLAIPDSLERIGILIKNLGRIEAESQQTKAQVGYLLADIQEKESWRGHYENFHQFLMSLEDLYNQSYSSLYSYFSTARELKELVTPEQFEQIGIGKAQELAKAHKNGILAPDAIQTALDPTITAKSLSKALIDASEPLDTPEQEDRTWYDFSLKGYATKEEVLVLESAVGCAWKTEPITPEEWPEARRNLSAFLKLAMEYLSTHSDKGEF